MVKYDDLKINNLNNPSLLEIIDVFRVKIMREIIYLYKLKRKYLKNKYIFEIKIKTLITYQFLPFRMIDN